MATSRSRGAAGSRGGRTGASGLDYYHDESPDVILPAPPPGSRGSGGTRRGSGAAGGASGRAGTGNGRRAGGSAGTRAGGSASGRGRATSGGRSGTAGTKGGKSGAKGGKGKLARPVNTRGGAGRGKTRAGRGKNAPASSRGRKGAPPPSRNVLVALTGWLLRAVAMAWLVIAGLVGSVIRRFGRNARDLHPDHKRDGIGLAFLGLAIVFAAAVWARLHNTAFTDLYLLTSSAAGEGAFAIPVLFALAGWRFMRHPDRNSALPPAEIGWTALLIGALGLLHIARGIPTLSRHGGGWPAVRTAGGLIGLATSWPLERGLTAWVATPLLGLLAAYGLLVVTGTPVRQVPSRLAEFKELFGYSSHDDWNDAELGEADAEAPPVEGGKRRGEINRGPIRLKGAIEAGDQRKPYDPQVLLTGGRRSGRGAGPADPVPEARIGEGLLEDLGFTTQTDAVPAPEEHPVMPPAPGRPRGRPPPARFRRARCCPASSSRSAPTAAASTTRCRRPRCSARAARTRPGPRPTTRSWPTCRTCSSSSR